MDLWISSSSSTILHILGDWRESLRFFSSLSKACMSLLAEWDLFGSIFDSRNHCVELG